MLSRGNTSLDCLAWKSGIEEAEGATYWYAVVTWVTFPYSPQITNICAPCLAEMDVISIRAAVAIKIMTIWHTARENLWLVWVKFFVSALEARSKTEAQDCPLVLYPRLRHSCWRFTMDGCIEFSKALCTLPYWAWQSKQEVCLLKLSMRKTFWMSSFLSNVDKNLI